MFDLRDIKTTSDGDLVAKDGDLAVSTVTESLMSGITFCLLTELTTYRPYIDFGASPEKFLGKPNDAITRGYIKNHIAHYLDKQGLVEINEYQLSVLPVAPNEIAIILKILLHINEIDEAAKPQETILAFKYDFNKGTLEKVQ